MSVSLNEQGVSLLHRLSNSKLTDRLPERVAEIGVFLPMAGILTAEYTQQNPKVALTAALLGIAMMATGTIGMDLRERQKDQPQKTPAVQTKR